MSTQFRALTPGELSRAFGGDDGAVFPPVLTTKQAADLLQVKPKTVNAWKNAGQLEGTYRQQRREDRYWRDRLIQKFFNGEDWS